MVISRERMKNLIHFTNYLIKIHSKQFSTFTKNILKIESVYCQGCWFGKWKWRIISKHPNIVRIIVLAKLLAYYKKIQVLCNSQCSEYIFISLHPQSVPELLPPVLLREAFGGQQTSRSSLLCCVCISSSCMASDGRTRDDTANTMNVTSQKLTQIYSGY